MRRSKPQQWPPHTLQEVVRAGYSNHGDGKSPVLPRHIQSLRVMTQLELNVVNAAKRVIVAEDDGTAAGACRYARAYDRLAAAVSALATTEQRERRERARERARVQRERKRARAEASHDRP